MIIIVSGKEGGGWGQKRIELLLYKYRNAVMEYLNLSVLAPIGIWNQGPLKVGGGEKTNDRRIGIRINR